MAVTAAARRGAGAGGGSRAGAADGGMIVTTGAGGGATTTGGGVGGGGASRLRGCTTGIASGGTANEWTGVVRPAFSDSADANASARFLRQIY